MFGRDKIFKVFILQKVIYRFIALRKYFTELYWF